MQFGMHTCVLHPRPVGIGFSVEGVGVRVAVDALPLAQDYAGKHPTQRFIFGRKLYIGPNLRATVAKPHRMDVACIDKGIGLSILALFKVDGGVERVGITGCKHLRQLLVGELADNLCNLPFNSLRAEESLFNGWAKILSRSAFRSLWGQKGQKKG